MINQIIKNWIKEYGCKTEGDYKNALKEIIQELALEGLARAKFFDKAAFYGGTCLRILYQLDRFSEDLDFSLLYPDLDFKLEPYLNSIETHIQSYGFSVSVKKKEKVRNTEITSAFVKANTKENLIRIGLSPQERQRIHMEESIQIKLEIDVDPPMGFETEMVEMHKPSVFYVKSYALPDLFAGKMSALLARAWKGRIKGRDWYDLVWYVAKKVPLHLSHLETRLKQVAFIENNVTLSPEIFAQIYREKVETLDVAIAKLDVAPFILRPDVLDVWSKSYFLGLLPKITYC